MVIKNGWEGGEGWFVGTNLCSLYCCSLWGDEAMICSALLHDVVEDTHFSLDEVRLEFGDEVAQIVDALPKIVELRDENIPQGISNAKILTQALSFRKVLLPSIKDVRAIFVKICDRLQYMLTS